MGGECRDLVTLVDRRPSQVSNPQEWLFQKQVEDVLFPESFRLKTNGAFYRLLKRSAARGNATLCRTMRRAVGNEH